jgi:MazG family protein
MSMPADAPVPVPANAPGTPPDFSALLPEVQRLCEVIARLRAPDGCPWDRQQTLSSIKPYTLEETHELLEAIDSDDNSAIREELGDLLLQVILDAQIAADERRFLLVDVVRQIADKMVRRHPHVFNADPVDSVDTVKSRWLQIKQQEKPARESRLDGIPLTLPQLARAARITSRAAAVGYDFPDRCMLFDKLNEELGELAAELFADGQTPVVPATVDAPRIPDAPISDPAQKARAESELGDVLFVLANIGRRWGINPEEALRKTNAKFTRRFQAIEKALQAVGKTPETVSLREMEDIYQAAKKLEKQQLAQASDS